MLPDLLCTVPCCDLRYSARTATLCIRNDRRKQGFILELCV